MKKFTALLLSCIMVFSMSSTTFAIETEPMSQEEIRAKIVEIVATSTSTDERDELLSNFLEENPLAPVTRSGERVQRSSQSDATPSTEVSTLELVDSVAVDENTEIDFYSTGDFGIKEVEDLGYVGKAARASSYTNTYRTSYTIKNLFGGKIVETYVKGYFKYDGTNTPTAYLEDAAYSKGTLIFWDCSSWDDGTGTKASDKTAYCYADAYYDWTLDVSLGGSVGGDIDGGVEGEISGEISDGLTIQDCNVYLKLICSKSGSISATVSLED